MTIMIQRTAKVTLALTAALAVGSWGCGPSEEEAAVARLMDMPAPARIRMVNLSGVAITMISPIRALETNLKPGSYCKYRMLGSGSRDVVFKAGDQEIATISREFGAEKLYTAVIADTGSGLEVHLIEGEILAPTASTNLRTFYIGVGRKASSVPITLASGGNIYTVGPKTDEIKLEPGNYTLSGAGVSDTLANTVEGRGMYSLFVVDAGGGKRFAYMIQNNPPDRPAIAGQAQT